MESPIQDTLQNNSMKKSTMLATVFHGDKRVFQDAIDEGAIWSDPEDDTRYMYDMKVKKDSDIKSQKRTGQEIWQLKGADAGKKFRGGMADMLGDNEGSARPDWMKIKATPKGERKAIKDDCANDNDMLLLQNCNDSLTSITLDLQRMAPSWFARARARWSRSLRRRACTS